MKIAYLDCASGVSGDMLLGALVDAGISLAEIQTGIDSLRLPVCRLEHREVHRCGFRAAKISVRHAPEHVHRHLHEIVEMIDASQLTERQKELATAIFRRLAAAEAQVHGTTMQEVHFHEVGAVDSIADIVGTAIGWDCLGAEKLYCSPIPTGQGEIQIAHGRTSIPAPATAELLKGVPLAASHVRAELTTPTGAAIVATLADVFGPLPAMTIEQIGYGAGERDHKQQGNILRLLVGASAEDVAHDTVTLLETNLDDVTGETIGYCLERVLAAGALDAFTTPIQMKKTRQAVQLSVLCDPAQRPRIESILFQETGTLGIRRITMERTKLPREPWQVTTKWGPLAGKVSHLPDGSRRFSPEFESCRRIAEQQQLAVETVAEEARRQFHPEE